MYEEKNVGYIETETYYHVVEGNYCSYGAYVSFDEAMRAARDNGNVSKIVKRTETTEVVWVKDNYEIKPEDAERQLQYFFDDSTCLPSKAAVEYALKCMREKTESK